MYEVEVKVRADHETARNRLDEEGATALGTVRQADVYYDAPHRNFAETDEALRIRREDDGSVARLTYKGPLVEAASKTRRELETGIEDADELDAILGELDFEPAATVAKRRERYEFEGYAVTLDAVDGLGEFVEIERETDERSVEAARERAYELLERLGLNPSEQIRRSYLELLLDADGE